jgi:hypothetical protein
MLFPTLSLEVWNSMFLRNVYIYLQIYMALQPNIFTAVRTWNLT